MRASTSTRTPDTFTAALLAFLFSAAFSHRRISTGKERDTESGLDYFGFRYYGSSMGRFTSPDPIGIMVQKLLDPQQWNEYAYSKNNPLRFIDPTGMYVTTCKAGDKVCAQNASDFEKARQRD